MRVTQGMLANNMLRNISDSYARMAKYQEQLATGKKISRPSDDPVVAMKGINYRTQLTKIQQFQRNINEVHTWMDNSDSALDKATQALQRVRELTVQASNDTYEQGQRGNIAKEIRQLKDHLVSIANTQVNDKYIFNGLNTTEAPVDGETHVVDHNSMDVKIEVSAGVELKVNVSPDQVFSQDLFEDLENFANALEDSDELGTSMPEAEFGEFLSTFDTHINNIIEARADLGARMNRVDLISDRLETQEISASRMLSTNEDAQIEKVITNLKTQESVHRAALGVGARVIQPTLMDFLR